MSLIHRRLRAWPSKLFRASRTVNGTRGALAASAIAAMLGACAGPQRHVPRTTVAASREYLGDPARAPSADERVDGAPVRVWRGRASRGTAGALAVGERVTALTTVDRFVELLDTRTGRRFWRARADGTFSVGPLLTSDRVIVATEGAQGRVSAYDLYSSRRRWRTTVGDVTSPLALGDSSVYGVTTQGTAFALAERTGRRRWTQRVRPSRSGPLVTPHGVLFATLTDSLILLDRATGRVLARASLPGAAAAPLALANDSTVVVASPGGAVLAVALPSGAVRWTRPVGGAIHGMPAVARDTAFVLTAGCVLWRIPLAAPATADSASVGCVATAGPTVLRDGVLVATVGGELLAFDYAARQVRWRRSIGAELRHPAVVRSGQIFVAPILGEVVSLR
jgi:hypothetical protein